MLDSFSGSELGGDFAFEPEPAIDIEAERRQAHDEGYQEAAEAAALEHEAALAELAARHEQELMQLASVHEQDVVAKVHARFQEMTNELANSIAEQTLQALLPVFSQELAGRAVDRLYDLIRQALTDRDVTMLTVRGKADLYEALKLRLDADGVESRFIESASLDLSVEIDDAVLVTRLESWAQALAEVTE